MNQLYESMVAGFELITQPLTEYETETLLPVFLTCLSKHNGKEEAITSVQIVKGMRRHGYKCRDVNVRKVINHIRIYGLIPNLLATSSGYYVSNDKEEIRLYIESLRQRESAIRAVRRSIEAQAGYSSLIF